MWDRAQRVFPHFHTDRNHVWKWIRYRWYTPLSAASPVPMSRSISRQHARKLLTLRTQSLNCIVVQCSDIHTLRTPLGSHHLCCFLLRICRHRIAISYRWRSRRILEYSIVTNNTAITTTTDALPAMSPYNIPEKFSDELCSTRLSHTCAYYGLVFVCSLVRPCFAIFRVWEREGEWKCTHAVPDIATLQHGH